MKLSWLACLTAIIQRLHRRRSPRRRDVSWLAGETLELRQLMSATPAEVSFAGRGQDLLLVVNPNDETALRIANAYQQLRHIPDINIVFLAPPLEAGFADMTLDHEQFLASIVTPIANAIRDRGLTNQIDFIGALGLPVSFSFSNPNHYGSTDPSNTIGFQSLSYGLTELTQYANGLPPVMAQFVTTAMSSANSGSAIHHSATAQVRYNDGVVRSTQYYVGGLIGFTGSYGNSPDQAIAGLIRSAAADGTHPAGTIYFEENNDVRSNMREPQWPAAQAALRARGILVHQESNTAGATPQGRTDVRGAATGYYQVTLPNGSTYLPGSWGDNATSYGGSFGDGAGQTKSTEFLAAGAAATSGTVAEPGPLFLNDLDDRFVSASVFVSIDDGLTLGEAYARSISRPDVSQFFGDLLAQPYADLPRVQITAGPAEGQTVSGTLAVTANATLNNPRFATGIARLELYLDGALRRTINASQGTFNLDSIALADGVHELRVVAVNNSRAESEGIALRRIVVNNRGRSISATAPRATVGHHEVFPVTVTTTLRSGSVVRVEMRHLGRSIGQLTGNSGNISLDASRLAFGENRIVPVAIFADGEQVLGASFVVSRSSAVFAAQPASNPVDRTAGIRAEYFLNRGAATIAASDFSGTPDIVRVQNSLQLTASDLATTAVDRLAVRFTGRFQVTGSADSEFLFSLLGTNDSARLSVDGRPIVSFDGQPYGVYGDASSSLVLAPGEHSFELLVSNLNASDPGLFRVDLRMRGPDGVTRVVDRSNAFVTAATPTPNRAPSASADSYSVTQPQTLDVTSAGVLANDTDADGNRLTARLVNGPQHGTVTLRTDGSFTYVPTVSYDGTDSFSYVASDGQAESTAATVTIEIRTALVVAPQPPTTVSASDGSSTDHVRVTWARSDRATAYEVWRNTSNNSGTATKITPSDLTATAFDDATAAAGTSYWYWVKARNAGGTSGFSSADSGSRASSGPPSNGSHNTFFVSTTTSGTVANSNGSTLRFTDADILQLAINADGTYQYSFVFDGSDVGLTTPNEDIDAFDVLIDGRILISTVGAFSVPHAGGGSLTGNGEDLLLFTPTSVGERTAGSWQLYFDGSDVLLSGSNETIDAVALLPDGRLLISTAGTVSVRGLTSADEDVLVFTPTSLGNRTAGSFAVYVDASDVGLTADSEDVSALCVLGDSATPQLYFATRGNFAVPGLSGANEDIFALNPTRLGTNTRGTFGPGLTLDGSRFGLSPFSLDGISLDDVSISTTPRTVTPPPQPPTQGGTVLINEDFEDGQVNGFSYVPAISPQTQIVAGDSYASGNKAYQITYATDEFDAKLEKYNIQANSLDVSFASKLPDGIPIENGGRGFASLALSRLIRESGTPSGRGIQQTLTYSRAGIDGPNSPAHFEMTYHIQFSNRVFRTPVAITPEAWLHTRYFIRFNSPGQNDGLFMVWHNGQLVINARDVAFSDTVASRIDSLLVGGHLSYGGTHPDRPFRRLIDNVRLVVNGDVPNS